MIAVNAWWRERHHTVARHVDSVNPQRGCQTARSRVRAMRRSSDDTEIFSAPYGRKRELAGQEPGAIGKQE